VISGKTLEKDEYYGFDAQTGEFKIW